MGSSRHRSTTPDLFSTISATVPLFPSVSTSPSSPAADDGGATASSPSYALPTNLPSALKHLDDDQLDRLLVAVISELKQRGKNIPVSNEPLRRQHTKEVAPPLAQGKLNAVRAALKAGVRPSRIAKQFGISQSDVRKALANDPSKWDRRSPSPLQNACSRGLRFFNAPRQYQGQMVCMPGTSAKFLRSFRPMVA